jgi:hypothetical protein
MCQTIELNDFLSVETSGSDFTTLKIVTQDKATLILELDNDLADEIASCLFKKLYGYYPDDKLGELEYKIDELRKEKDNLQELLAEERLGRW